MMVMEISGFIGMFTVRNRLERGLLVSVGSY